MVAKIITGKSIQGVLNYNENKVKQGQAELLGGQGFTEDDASRLTFYQKLERFKEVTSLNSRTKTNAIHISLNFSNEDKLNDPLLMKIADDYMQRISFGEQPYLVYRHYDAGHPHIHIAATNIQTNRKRIETHNLGKTKSEDARKTIEKSYNLVVAEEQKKKDTLLLKSLDKATYGKAETKAALSNIVSQVVKGYKYTSLAELNAILRQLNVTAYRGEPGTRMYERVGLVYSITDEKGNMKGTPVKSSALYGKPTWANLKKRFERNKPGRKPHAPRLMKTIDTVLNTNNTLTKETFIEALRKKGIATTFHTNEQGRTYGITFVDNVKRCAFKGSALGKGYSTAAILSRLEVTHKQETDDWGTVDIQEKYTLQGEGPTQWTGPDLSGLYDLLEALTSKYAEEQVAWGFRRRKRKQL